MSPLKRSSARRRRARRGTGKGRSVPTLCGVCPGGCGVVAHVEGGRLVGVEADREHPVGLLCPRGARAPEIVHSPDRLLSPMVRGEARPGAPFRRASWDEAYDVLVEGLTAVAERHGPESVCMYTGRGNFDYGLNETFAPEGPAETSASSVLFPFGSPSTTGVGSLCYVAYGMIAPRSCFGLPMRETRVDLEGAELIVVWGANPAVSAPLTMRRVKQARARGARVIVVDPRRTETARATGADWVGLRPGTDGALALGLIHVMVKERLYDEAFVRRWTHGFDELAAYAEAFAPARVEELTSVPAVTVARLARELALTARCSVLTYTGLEYSNGGVQSIRALWCAQALAGNLDVPGGNRFRDRRRFRLTRTVTPSPEGAPRPFGAEEHPLYFETRNEAHGALLPRAILEGKPYPVRALVVSGSSLLTSWPQPDLWRRALERLELLVVIDRFPTADAGHAHLVLPATTGYESESYALADLGHSAHVTLARRVIEPLGEARSDYQILTELARRLGYGHRWPATEEGMIAAALAGTGISLDELRRADRGITVPDPEPLSRKWETGGLREDGAPGFDTPTGAFELSSVWLERNGYEPLPVYVEPFESPGAGGELSRRYPLVLSTGSRTRRSFRSQHHNIPGLADREPAPLASLHPDDALARGIEDGDEVVVATSRGEATFVARVTRDIVPGVVEAAMGGGGPLGPEAWRRTNVNELTDLENRDPISGFPVFKALLCEVRPALSKGEEPSAADGSGLVAA